MWMYLETYYQSVNVLQHYVHVKWFSKHIVQFTSKITKPQGNYDKLKALKHLNHSSYAPYGSAVYALFFVGLDVRGLWIFAILSLFSWITDFFFFFFYTILCLLLPHGLCHWGWATVSRSGMSCCLRTKNELPINTRTWRNNPVTAHMWPYKRFLSSARIHLRGINEDSSSVSVHKLAVASPQCWFVKGIVWTTLCSLWRHNLQTTD